MQEAHDPYGALRHPDYRRLLAGNVLGAFGTEIQSMAVGWELYERTESALNLGLVGLVQIVPILLLALPAGHAADRYSRKGLLASAQGLMACASLGLTWLSWVQGPVPLVYLCLLLAGISRGFSMPARWALVPQVVPAGALTNAITWNSSGYQLASVLGPALGGAVIGFTDRAAGAYLLAAGCSLTCMALVFSTRPRSPVGPRQPLSLKSLLAGVAYVLHARLILATITLDLFAVLFGGATALLPIFARDILHVGPEGLGWLRAAPALGALVMALGMAHRPPMRRAGRSLLIAVAGFGLATVGFGLSRDFGLSFVLLALTGALDNISMVVRGTLVQVLTPDEMRGRVSAVNSIFINTSNQLGAFESGVTAEWFGPEWSVIGGGLATLVVIAVVTWVWPEVLQLGPLQPSATEPAPAPQPERSDGS